jgi:hypothetical protein
LRGFFYRLNKLREASEQPPFAENVFQWVSQFIKKGGSINLTESCGFLFPKTKHESVFSLPLRMSGTLNLTGHPLLEDSDMAGVRIALRPNQAGLQWLIQDVAPGSADSFCMFSSV